MATDQAGKIVPGIPLGALDAIGDANVRDVLRALVATHNVRNNLAGTGNEAFITTRQALIIARNALAGSDTTGIPLPARYMHGAGGDVYGPGTLSGPLGSMTVALASAASYLATVCWMISPIFFDCGSRVELHDETGRVLLTQSDGGQGGYPRSQISSAGFRLEAGIHTITMHAGNDRGGFYTMGAWGVLLLPVAS